MRNLSITTKLIWAILFVTMSTYYATGQAAFKIKADYTYLHQIGNTKTIDPSENWQGYYLKEGQNGSKISLVSGAKLIDLLFIGLGGSYLKFDDIQGHTIFGEIALSSEKPKIKPVLGVRCGYSHINNQYEGGTKTAYADLNIGIAYKCNDKLQIQLDSGLTFMQQHVFFPVRIGIRFL